MQQMIKLTSLGEEVLTQIMHTVLCGFSFSITLMSAMATQYVYMLSWSDGHTWQSFNVIWFLSVKEMRCVVLWEFHSV